MEQFKVKAKADWYSDEQINKMLVKQTPGKKGEFNNIKLVMDDNEADYFAVFNNTNDSVPQDKTFYFTCEPPKILNPAYNINKKHYEHNYSIENYHMPIYWDLMNIDYDYLLNNSPEKTEWFSGITSSKRWMEGHVLRVNFVGYLDQIDLYHHYGPTKAFGNLRSYKGTAIDNGVIKKEEALLPYKYTVNNENCEEKNYFTEKLTDAILCECLCFYWGCPNVEDFINPKAFIRIDMRNPEQARNTIIESIRNKEWEKRIDIIREEKQKLLKEKQILAFLSKKITEENK